MADIVVLETKLTAIQRFMNLNTDIISSHEKISNNRYEYEKASSVKNNDSFSPEVWSCVLANPVSDEFKVGAAKSLFATLLSMKMTRKMVEDFMHYSFDNLTLAKQDWFFSFLLGSDDSFTDLAYKKTYPKLNVGEEAISELDLSIMSMLVNTSSRFNELISISYRLYEYKHNALKTMTSSYEQKRVEKTLSCYSFVCQTVMEILDISNDLETDIDVSLNSLGFAGDSNLTVRLSNLGDDFWIKYYNYALWAFGLTLLSKVLNRYGSRMVLPVNEVGTNYFVNKPFSESGLNYELFTARFVTSAHDELLRSLDNAFNK